MNLFNYTILTLIILLFIFLNQITKYINYYDYPDNSRKIHKSPISKLAGIIIFFICLNIFVYEYFNQNWSSKFIYLIIISLTFIFLLNLFDDYKNISANFRLIITSIVLFFLFTINSDFSVNKLYFSSIDKIVYLNQGSIFFSLLCVLLLSNAINLFDGFNGISLSHFLIWYLILFNENIFNNYFYLANLIFLVLLLIINLKNISFIGNSGSACIGFFISILIINSYHSGNVNSVENIFLFFLIPGIDMLRLFVLRIASKKNPFDADNQHLHHYIIKNFKNKLVLPIYLCISLSPILFGYLIDSKYHLYLIIFCIVIYSIIVKFLKNKIKNV
tara:strand:- start:153 stop:1148 length:996 start_codon:yes stop_codon:yes gene_type:complete